MLKNIKQKITKKNIGFLLTAVVVLLGSGVFVIYAQTTSCSSTYSCLSDALLGVTGNAYVAKDVAVNYDKTINASGRLVVKNNSGAEKFIVESMDSTGKSSGKITSPTISDSSDCGGFAIARKWKSVTFTTNDGLNSCTASGLWNDGAVYPRCTLSGLSYGAAYFNMPTADYLAGRCWDNGDYTATCVNNYSWWREICMGE